MSAFSIAFDCATPAGLADLNTFLASRSYIVGFSPSASDVVVFNAIGSAPDKNTYPNVFRYYSHIASFGNKTAKFKNPLSAVTAGAVAPPPVPAAGAGGAGSAGAGAAKAAPAKADSDSDDDGDDLFGGSDSDDGAVVKAAAPAPAAAPKKAKKKKIERTQLTFYVNAIEYPCDMEALEASVRTVEMEGLSWGEAFDVNDIGYGIQKLHVQCIIVNDLLGTDDVTAAVEALETVSSTDAGTMNRLG